MELTLGQIQDMKDALRRLSEERIPLKTAFKLNKLINVVDDNLQIIEDQRIKLVNKLGTEDKDGSVSIDAKDTNAIQTFQKEYMELMDEKIELDFDLLVISELPDVKLSTQDMLKLASLFKE